MFERFIKAMERTGQEKLRVYLMHMPTDFLTEHGYSREKLELGVDAWPWSIETKKDAPFAVTSVPAPATKESSKQKQEKITEALEPLDWVA